MITKEEFTDLILKQQKWSDRVDEVSEALNVPTLFESDWVEYAASLFDKTINFLFTEEGIDDISWWLYEKSGNPELKMWDADENEIPTDTIDDLWEIVKDSRK